MNEDELISRINLLADQICLKKCEKLMSKECKKKHCPIYNIVENSQFHYEMGWTSLLSKNVENLEKRMR